MLLPPKVLAVLNESPKIWLITGVAGFIGSNLLEALLEANQQIIGLDNFSTGNPRNLAEVLNSLPASARERFRFVAGDIRDGDTCRRACEGVDLVLHQAALGSVPFSIEHPEASHENNVPGH